MKTIERFYIGWLLPVGLILILILNSCQKNETDEIWQTLDLKITALNDRSVILSGENKKIGSLNDESSASSSIIFWSTNHNPSIHDCDYDDYLGDSSFIHYKIAGLMPNTTYYVRTTITSEGGAIVKYSDEIKFTTTSNNDGKTGTISDIEGNVYKTVTIGTQTWMAENLKTKKYQNGDIIDVVEHPIFGCYYDNYQVRDDRNIAPIGWHVSTENDWTELSIYLGGYKGKGTGKVADKLKETGTSHWYYPNFEATNEVGFSALPGGCYVYNEYHQIGSAAYFLLSDCPYVKEIRGSTIGLTTVGDSPVRCVKN